MAGVYKIGPGGSYTTITSALSALSTNGVAGSVILELKSNYVTIGETFPLNFTNIPCASATKTITLRPEAGATGISIHSASQFVAISLNQAKYIIIDGRPGGTGTVSELSITSASPNGAILFNNDASYNTVKYTNVGSAGAYVITFGSSPLLTVSNGNRFNLISHCLIGEYFGGWSSKGIQSTGGVNKKNNNNRVSNCQFKNYPGGVGINIAGNNGEWMVDSNSFFHSNQISNSIAILIDDTTSSGYNVIGNYIGGDSPNCQGNPVIINNNYLGISLAVGNQSYSTIDGNTIANMKWYNNIGFTQFSGIQIRAGKVKCGDIIGNTIGSLTDNENITSESFYLTTPMLTGIHILCNSQFGNIDSVIVQNNSIGGIKSIAGQNNYLETMLRAIYVEKQYTGHLTIRNNQIGSPVLENSLESTVWMGEYSTRGIDVEIDGTSFATTIPIANIISGNTIAHLNGQVLGISLTGGKSQVTNNIIRDILSQAPVPGTTLPVIVCISSVSCSPGTLISENTMYNCRLKGTFGASVNGVFADYANGIEISKNKVFAFYSEPPGASIKGIYIYPEFSAPAFGKYKVNNNMICLGVDTAGNVINQPNEIYGISVPLDSSIITHNSVYLGSGSGDGESAALHLNGTDNSASRITNNILVNLRTVQPVNFYRHYCIKFENSITSFNQLYCNYNLYHNVGSSQNFLGAFNSVLNPLSANLTNWKANSGLDLNSLSGNPNFKNPLGNYLTSDLHLNLPTIADAAGIIELDILFDIDNELRTLFTPVDIGADAPNPSATFVSEISDQRDVLIVYPNPVKDKLYLKLSNNFKILDVSILSLVGKQVIVNAEILPGYTEINVQQLLEGVYLISATDTEGVVHKARFVKI
jgi:hypothetical protein